MLRHSTSASVSLQSCVPSIQSDTLLRETETMSVSDNKLAVSNNEKASSIPTTNLPAKAIEQDVNMTSRAANDTIGAGAAERGDRDEITNTPVNKASGEDPDEQPRKAPPQAKICGICNENPGKYKCPRCGLPL